MKAVDAVRTSFVRRLYRVDPTDPSLYHMVIDSTALPLDTVVDVIIEAASAAPSTVSTGTCQRPDAGGQGSRTG